MSQRSPSWDTVEEWWQRYGESQRSELAELQSMLNELRGCWQGAGSPFDTDPLSINWSSDVRQAGPLRTGQEENWSRWLAELIRDSSGTFTTALFGSTYEHPTTVRCERAFHDEELHDRRVDIIAEFDEIAVTIEVKIGDEYYEKTGQAAYLAERDDPQNRAWDHYLLLPEGKREALQAAFEDRLKERGDQTVVEPANPQERPITVLYWSQIARTLRRTLLTDQELRDHWNASAFLFTTLIEQKIMDFYSQAAIERVQSDVIGITDVQRLQSIDPGDQLDYLKDVVSEVTHG